jgi:hypothetical protein
MRSYNRASPCDRSQEHVLILEQNYRDAPNANGGVLMSDYKNVSLKSNRKLCSILWGKRKFPCIYKDMSFIWTHQYGTCIKERTFWNFEILRKFWKFWKFWKSENLRKFWKFWKFWKSGKNMESFDILENLKIWKCLHRFGVLIMETLITVDLKPAKVPKSSTQLKAKGLADLIRDF